MGIIENLEVRVMLLCSGRVGLRGKQVAQKVAAEVEVKTDEANGGSENGCLTSR